MEQTEAEVILSNFYSSSCSRSGVVWQSINLNLDFPRASYFF